MSLRAISLGSVEFLYPLWVKEAEEPSSVITKVYMNALGGHIVYNKPIITPYMTLVSKDYALLSEDNINMLNSMYWDLSTETYPLSLDSGQVITVRLAREKQMTFVPLWEGKKKYKVKIPLAEVGQ